MVKAENPDFGQSEDEKKIETFAWKCQDVLRGKYALIESGKSEEQALSELRPEVQKILDEAKKEGIDQEAIMDALKKEEEWDAEMAEQWQEILDSQDFS